MFGYVALLEEVCIFCLCMNTAVRLYTWYAVHTPMARLPEFSSLGYLAYVHTSVPGFSLV